MTAAVGVGLSEEQAPNLTPPPGNPRFPMFDGLRAIAALAVFAGHCVTVAIAIRSPLPTYYVWAVQVASEGVAIFFLISGFLLYRPFLTTRRSDRRLRVASYGKRRFLRIVPAYWVALTVFIAAGFVQRVTPHNWWIYYGFGQIYDLNTLGFGISAAWTLCVEVTFYGVLPLFAWLAARFGRSARWFVLDLVLLVLLSAASLAWRAHYSGILQVSSSSTLAGTFFWFALGMGLAVVSVLAQERRWGARRRVPLARVWPVLSWGAAALLFWILHRESANVGSLGIAAQAVTTHVVFGLVALLIILPGVLGEADGGPARAVLRFAPLTWIGLISYGFYLYHVIVIDQLNRLIGARAIGWTWLALIAGSFALTVACAAASYYLLERPIMLLGRRTWIRRGRAKQARPSGGELLGTPNVTTMQQQPDCGPQRLDAVDDRLPR